MSYRFTNTEKWADAWFSNLTQIQMLVFIYLCDNCDIAGFIEVNYKRWASDLGSTSSTIEGACKGFEKGLTYSKDQDCIYINNFLKHQKNLPLNEKNPAHVGILKRFAVYSYKFDIQDITIFIEGACKGLQCPYGNGNGNGKGKLVSIPIWKTDFEVYKKEGHDGFQKCIHDAIFMARMEHIYPKTNIRNLLNNEYTTYWKTEESWEHKKAKGGKTINWMSTVANCIKFNHKQYSK